jgi:hypothetical protein
LLLQRLFFYSTYHIPQEDVSDESVQWTCLNNTREENDLYEEGYCYWAFRVEQNLCTEDGASYIISSWLEKIRDVSSWTKTIKREVLKTKERQSKVERVEEGRERNREKESPVARPIC